eukprot:COSAG01_NODE_7608_length_3129_cov_1.233333_3_plen_141_part_00
MSAPAPTGGTAPALPFSVAGVTYHALKTMTPVDMRALAGVQLQGEPANEYDSRAIAVYGTDRRGVKLMLGYVPVGLLPRAHRCGWCQKEWGIADCGRFHAFNRRDIPFMKLAETRRLAPPRAKKPRVAAAQEPALEFFYF